MLCRSAQQTDTIKKKFKDISKFVPEGVEGIVKFKGPVNKIIYNLTGGLRSSMGYLGAKTINDLQKEESS